MSFNRRKMPVGIQSFESLCQDGYIYVDKTALIYELVHEGKTFFLSRPRRFGKSMLVSTLQAYFEGKKELFAGLAIEELEKNNPDAWTQYPVLNFNFAGGDYTQSETLPQVIDRNLREIEAVYGRDTAALSESERFYSVIKAAYNKTGKGVVILVDEYDKPLLDTISNPDLMEKNRNLFKGFFGVLKATDQWTKFSLLTGVTKFAKVSIFSDLNQLRDISMTAKFENLCGITQKELETVFAPEIAELAKATNKTDAEILAKLKEQYDGYHFCEETCKNEYGMYNPFSLLNTFANVKFSNYWVTSGTSKFLVEILEQAEQDLRELLNGIEVGSDAFAEYRADPTNPVPIIYQSGYLTIKDYDDELGLYTLAFPNEEVAAGFLFLLAPEYTGLSETRKEFYIAYFVKELRAGDTEAFMQRLQSVYATLPTHRRKDRDVERDFQVVFLILFELMGLSVQAELQVPAGRCDAVVQTKDFVYVLEFKLSRDGGKTNSARDALNQINEKGYAVPYQASGKTLIKIGAQFNGDTGALEEWLVERG